VSDLREAINRAAARAKAADASLADVDLGLLFVGFDGDAAEVSDLIERHAQAMATKITGGLPWGSCLRGLYAQGLLAGLLVGQIRSERERAAA
jgi:hypothetical protein